MTKKFILILMIALISVLTARAQELASIETLEDQIRKLDTLQRSNPVSQELNSLNLDFLAARRAQLHALLEMKLTALQNYRWQARSILNTAERDALDKSIKEAKEKLRTLEMDISNQHLGSTNSVNSDLQRTDSGNASGATEELPAAEASSSSVPGSQPVLVGSTRSGSLANARFLLSHPGSGRTDLPTEDFTLSWTRARWATSFLVEVRTDAAFGSGGDVITATVTGPTSFKVPKDTLKAGVKYFWRVTSVDCDSSQVVCPAGGHVVAANTPFSFSTIRQLGFFNKLSDKGFSLQRVVSGDAESEGANFSFLHTFGKKTTYATDFAFIWDSKEKGSDNMRYTIESSIEGHLTSDESQAEDALRFGMGAAIVSHFGETGLKGLHSTFSGKLETDQHFTTKKLYFEALETPTAIKYFIGRFSGEVGDPVQFRWRPFFGLQVGHTFKRGTSALPEDTVFRLIPRARMEFKLNFISQALKIPRTLLFIDNTLYFLPLENAMKRPNFLASGLEFDFTPNLGLSFNYKNGRSAPKFQRIHTLGGAFTIRFGKNAE